jgi:hypothetical protein
MTWFIVGLLLLAMLRGVAILMAATAEAIAWGVGWVVARVQRRRRARV